MMISTKQRCSWIRLGLVIPGLIVVGAAWADPFDDDQALDMDFETAHTDWAQPYARGTIRVLYFTAVPFAGNYVKPRHIIELMQRFDVQARAVYMVYRSHTGEMIWHGGERGRQRILRLLKEPVDCFFFDRMALTSLLFPKNIQPTEAQDKILKAVSEGAGVVFLGEEDTRVLKRKKWLEDFPPFLAAARPKGAFTIAQGRGVKMTPPPSTPYRVGWEVDYDHWQERLGRAVLWAANRVPQVALSVSVAPDEFDRSALPHEAVTVRWNSMNAAGQLTFDIRLRSDDGKVVIRLPDEHRDAGDGTLTCAVPVLPAGGYHANVRTLSERGVEAWATAPFTVACSRRVESVKLDRDWGEIGEQISGEVTLAGRPLAGERLRIRLVDSRGRILVRQEVVPNDEPVRFRFPIEPWLPMLVRVEGALLDEQSEVTSNYHFARVVKRHQGQFNFLTWESPDFGPLADYVEQALADVGVTVQLIVRHNTLHEIAAHEISLVPYTTRLSADLDENGVMRPACWNDEPSIDEHVKSRLERWRIAREHGVFVYSLGDETVTRGSCVHPACLAAYRRYLETQYETIDALNVSWGTDFATFDDVQLSTPTDNEEEVAKAQKNYPRWYDRRAFQYHNFAQFCDRFGQAYRAIDPEARTGFEGAGRFETGDDFDLIVRTNGFWSPYSGPGDEVIRSIAPPGFTRSYWMGYSKGTDSVLANYWRMITRGCDSVWWWMWQNVGQYSGLVMPTLSPYPAVREMLKDTQVVRDGLGTLLIHSEMLDDGIAILYSMPSVYAAGFEAGPTYGSYSSAHTAWSDLIRELGLQYRYVTDRMLRWGEFDPKRYKALVLSRSEAISPAEADVIRQFAQDGGTVIADLRPGIYNGRCKPMPPGGGALDDLFGIQATAAAPDALVSQAVIDGTLAGQPVRVEWDKAVCEPGLTLTDSEALGQCGQAPLVIVRKVGKGQVVLLNFAVNLFPDIRDPDTPEAAVRLFQQLFASAGIAPVIKVQGENGQRPNRVETVRWHNGDTEMLALFRRGGEVETATVLLPEARHVYDLRRREYLGKIELFSTEILPNRATFFALTPERVGPVKMLLGENTMPRGQVARASVSVPAAGGTRAVRLSVWRPDKQEVKSLRQVVMVDQDGASCLLPIAYNDPTGTWTVKAVELFTNKETTVSLRVQ